MNHSEQVCACYTQTMKRRARIICTIGPASSSRRVISDLLAAGMNIARLNFSHGDHATHKSIMTRLRQVALRADKPLAIMQDLQGIKIRTGIFKDGPVELKKGSTLLLASGTGPCTHQKIFVSCPGIVRNAQKGDKVLINDGLIKLRVTGKSGNALVTKVLAGGMVSDRKGVNLPGMRITTRSFTPKDRADLDLGLAMGVDYVAVSFTRTAQDIKTVKNYIRKKGGHARVIAKIEKPEALTNLDAILHEAHGIMIARGDLGVEVPPEDVPVIQKQLIERANKMGKTVITATEMLESMTMKARPTRAEVSDVATAITDGADALMLSAETSTGRHPVKAVRMMDRVIRSTEAAIKTLPTYISNGTHSEAVAFAAAEAAESMGASLIVAFTMTGKTAMLLSKYRPAMPVAAFTPSNETRQRMAFYWGVDPNIMRPLTSIDEVITEVENTLKKAGLVRRGQSIIIVASSPIGSAEETNLMKAHKIGA